MQSSTQCSRCILRRFFLMKSITFLVLYITSLAAIGNAVTSMTLINAQTDTEISALQSGDVINIDDVGDILNIQANTSAGVESVRLRLSGTENHSRLENVAPYTLFGDYEGEYYDWTPSIGIIF